MAGPSLAFAKMMTPGDAFILTAASFNASAPHSARISNIRLLSQVTVSYEHSGAGPHWIEFWNDVNTGSLLHFFEVHPSGGSNPKESWTFPLIHPIGLGNQLDIRFVTNQYPAAGVSFKPSGDILVAIVGTKTGT